MNERELNNRKVTFTAYYNNEGHRVNNAIWNENDKFNIKGEFQGYTEFITYYNEEIIVAIVIDGDGKNYLVPVEFMPDFE